MVFRNLLSFKILTLFIPIALALYNINIIVDMDAAHYNASALNSRLGDFNFAAAGDWGCSANAKNTINNIIQKNPELVLGLGDYSYADSAKCWLDLISPIDEKMKITLGNHDHLIYTSSTSYYSSPGLLKEYMNHFNLSKQFYSFNFQNVHFISMSTEVPYESNSKQYGFVKDDLKKTISDPSINWIVVFYHRLAYTSPTFIDSIRALRDTYHPLFEKYGVDLVIQGHSHNYQRTFPISFNHQDSRMPYVMDKNSTNYHNLQGQIYTIVGTAGAYDVHNFSRPAAPYTAVQFNGFGFLNINVLNNGTMLQGNFYENNGTIMDHFTIDKSTNNHKRSNSDSSSTLPSAGTLKNVSNGNF